MELKFKGDGDRPKLPTLRQLLTQIAEADEHPEVLSIQERTVRVGNRMVVRPNLTVPPKTFLFDGYVYAIVMGLGKNVELGIDSGSQYCMNLRSQTIRAIDLDRQVEPIPVEVHVPSAKTHRYLHLHS